MASARRGASRCTSAAYSRARAAELFMLVEHRPILPPLAQPGGRGERGGGEERGGAYLTVRSHHGIAGVVGRWLRVRRRLGPGRTLERRAEEGVISMLG